MKKKEIKTVSMVWDYKEQIDFNSLTRILNGLGFKGVIREVDTNGDTHAIVIAEEKISGKQAQAAFEKEI
ncbi:hypothetical protein A2619_01085 [candidate division WWE3 bacterium RIFOXYD1_FULL_39_9]|uniref:DUF2007 domain-containing protein n=1 Tax=candidate division WWE3 bacterium RIFOXYD1_FULL_39_9 TaxID=1802649 RepID=A0A1F4X651_UNCKA|nr:MAG: hypothetical protein A2619_01085 [candidate division WWE3 bacterium RIFOXYD1_FULL_39_9]